MRSGNDAHRGLYRKFTVERTDGSSRPGGKHESCNYFVLDLTHDEFASAALRSYALVCRKKFPKLAADLLKLTRGAGLPPLRRQGGK